MPHPLTPDLGFGYLYPAAVTDNSFITYPFILTAVAFPVLGRAKDPLTEQTVPLGFKCSVIDRLRFFHFPAGPGPYLFRGSEPDPDALKNVITAGSGIRQRQSLLS